MGPRSSASTKPSGSPEAAAQWRRQRRPAPSSAEERFGPDLGASPGPIGPWWAPKVGRRGLIERSGCGPVERSRRARARRDRSPRRRGPTTKRTRDVPGFQWLGISRPCRTRPRRGIGIGSRKTHCARARGGSRARRGLEGWAPMVVAWALSASVGITPVGSGRPSMADSAPLASPTKGPGLRATGGLGQGRPGDATSDGGRGW